MRVLTTREQIRDAYSAEHVAHGYVDRRFSSAWGSVLHQTQLRAVNDVIRTHRAKRVLEIAPGPARLSAEVVGFDHGYLCDANDSMLRLAQDRLGDTVGEWQRASGSGTWHLIRGDAFALPFHGFFDLVYSFRFLRHFGARDRAALYDGIRPVLRDHGIFVFDAVNAVVSRPLRVKAGRSEFPVYDELYFRDDLIGELAAHGFQVVSLVEVMRHMTLQQLAQVLLAPRSYQFARRLIQLLEHVPGEPLEWIVICRRTGRDIRESRGGCGSRMVAKPDGLAGTDDWMGRPPSRRYRRQPV